MIPAEYIPTDGTYYLFVYVGDAGTVQERNGNYWDNFMYVPITVHRNLPDLVAQNVQGRGGDRAERCVHRELGR